MTWLMWANAVLWIGLGLYLAFLSRRHANLERRVSQWEAHHD